jgi:hypothetical protein
LETFLQVGNAFAIPEIVMKPTVSTTILLQPLIPRGKNEKVLESFPAMSLVHCNRILTASPEL